LFRPILRLRPQPDLCRRQNLVRFSVHWICPDCFIFSMRALFSAYCSGEIPEDRAISNSAVLSGARRPIGRPVVAEGTSRVGGAEYATDVRCCCCRGGGSDRGGGAECDARVAFACGLLSTCPLLLVAGARPR